MQIKAETFDGFTFKFFSTFQLEKQKKTSINIVLLIKTKMFYLTLLHCYVQSKINNIMHIG